MPQQPSPPIQNINLIFTVNELNIILKGLGELKAKDSLDLIIKIQNHWTQLQLEQKNQTRDRSTNNKDNGKQHFQEEIPKPGGKTSGENNFIKEKE